MFQPVFFFKLEKSKEKDIFSIIPTANLLEIRISSAFVFPDHHPPARVCHHCVKSELGKRLPQRQKIGIQYKELSESIQEVERHVLQIVKDER